MTFTALALGWAMMGPTHLGPTHGGQSPNQLSAADAIRKLDTDRDPLWVHACHEIDERVSDLDTMRHRATQRGAKLDIIAHVDANRNQIALTFDDGPHPAYTPRLLEILRRENVPATFFLVGTQAERYPNLVRDIARAGHTVGNHTYHHVSLPKIPLPYAAEEVRACGEVIRHILGRAPRFFRPPGGQFTHDIAQTSNLLGYSMVLWTANPGDFEAPGTRAIGDRTLAQIRPGGIILMHDGAEQTLQILPSLIEALKRRGYQFVSMDQYRPHSTALRIPDPPR